MKFVKRLLALNCAIFLISCASDSTMTVEQMQVKDDFSYVTVNSTGKINYIGNNTGAISSYSEFSGFNTAAFLNLSTITSNSNKIFLVENLGKDKLFIFDKKTKVTSSSPLVYPTPLTEQGSAIISLQWNDSKSLLFGIIKSDKDNSKSINYLVTINPTTFEVIKTGLSFNQTGSYSTALNGTKLYSSSYNDNAVEINLENYTSTFLFFNATNNFVPFTRAAVTTNNILYGLKALTGAVNGVSLVKFDLQSNIYTAILPDETYGIDSPFGKGFIDSANNQYVNIANKNNKSGILKYDILKNATEFVPVNGGSNTVIIEKTAN